MQIGKVTGSLWATRKDEKLNGLKLLLVEICTDETEDVRHSIVAMIMPEQETATLCLLQLVAQDEHPLGTTRSQWTHVSSALSTR